MKPRKQEQAGCWVLCDPALRVWWVGDGLRAVTGPAPPATWATQVEAQRAADEINEVLGAMGLKAVPTPVRVN